MARPKTVEPTGPQTPDEVDVSDIPSDRPESQDLANAIENANALLEQKREVLSKLQAIRQYTTLSIAAGNGSAEQVAWVRFYLPRKRRKENGSEDGSSA